MQSIYFLIKSASSLCNLSCKYCFYDDVSNHRKAKSTGIMTDKTINHLLELISSSNEIKNVTFAFQGGEPTIAGLDFYIRFINYVKEYKLNYTKNISYAFQTNGFNINEEWCKFFKENNVLVGISLDGYKENHDYFRLTKNGKATYNQIMKNIALLEKYHVEYNILTVLSEQLAKHPTQLYHFYKKFNFKYIQLIPCLPPLNEEDDVFSLKPHTFSSFYKTFFSLWYDDYIHGYHMNITLFENIIPMLVGIPPQQCGMLGKCTLQFVLEGNGDIYPCDFYVLDKYLIGNINHITLDELLHNKVSIDFVNEKRRTCQECTHCPYINICHQNCKRLNIAYFNNEYCGYKDFLDFSINKMITIARRIKF